MKIDMPAFDDAEGWLKRAREKRAKRWTIIGPDSFDELLPDEGPLLDEVQVSNAAIEGYEVACQAFEKRLAITRPEATRIEITAMPFIRLLRDQRDRLADVLRWMDRKGGLGQDVHAEIRKALDGIPSHEQQLRNVCEGLGITIEQLKAALDTLPPSPHASMSAMDRVRADQAGEPISAEQAAAAIKQLVIDRKP